MLAQAPAVDSTTHAAIEDDVVEWLNESPSRKSKEVIAADAAVVVDWLQKSALPERAVQTPVQTPVAKQLTHHRAKKILGITMIGFLGNAVFGLIAWPVAIVMAHHDLKAIKAGATDPSGKVLILITAALSGISFFLRLISIALNPTAEITGFVQYHRDFFGLIAPIGGIMSIFFGPIYCLCLIASLSGAVKKLRQVSRTGQRLDGGNSDHELWEMTYAAGTLLCAATIMLSWYAILFLLVPMMCGVVFRVAFTKPEFRLSAVCALAEVAKKSVGVTSAFLAGCAFLLFLFKGWSHGIDEENAHFQILVARAQEKVGGKKDQNAAQGRKASKLLIWDLDRGKVHNAQGRLPSNRQATVTSEEVTVALVHRNGEETIGHVYVGRIAGRKGHPMKRVTASVAVIQLPEGFFWGRYSVTSKDPTGTVFDLEGDIDTPIAELVSGVVGIGK